MVSISVEIPLDEFTDAQLITEMKLRNLHIVDCNALADTYQMHGKEAFYEEAKRIVENTIGKLLV
jgi:hypothetical protein